MRAYAMSAADNDKSVAIFDGAWYNAGMELD